MNLLRKIYVFIRRKNHVICKKLIVKKENELLKNINFVIIANNCWAGAVYQWYERPYNSPFAGIGIYGKCYLKLLSNFDYYMNQSLVFQTKSKYPDRELNYPMALLGNVEIHFTHYKTAEEAKTKWVRRVKRMQKVTDKNNYFFKICDSWGVDEKLFEKFHELPFNNKISFALKEKKITKRPNHIEIYEHHKKDKTIVPNGIKLFKISFLYFDLSNWLLTKKINRTTFKS